jgi:UDP-GlcNAc:undecaprenyl-phosphate/decaprenyl-phosphate GlcNAc-1-phosphate transferase
MNPAQPVIPDPLGDQFGLRRALTETNGLSDTDPSAIAPPVQSQLDSMLDIIHGYAGVFIVAFVVTMLSTPLLRRLAIANGVVDRPDGARKAHAAPVAYLGGVAVYLGLLAGIAYSYFAPLISEALFEAHPTSRQMMPVPIAVVLGMTVIMLTGLIDDLVGISPRIKIAGQLFAAAALAMQDVGVKVASGVLRPIGRLFSNSDMIYTIPLPEFIPISGGVLTIDIIYWTGTAIIAIFILGACNASNLIDGLDGLLSGVSAISAVGLLIIALGMAWTDDGMLDASRLVLCLCLLGACMGFLPHNFRPASIFLGDCGSLLLGYMTIVVILTLGDTGKTPLVVAGLIIYALPIIDTTLAIVRRKMAGLSISAPDDQHLHHMLKRSVGVVGAVFTLYGISAVFAALGILVSTGRARLAYTVALVVASFIGVTAVKLGRRNIIAAAAAKTDRARPKDGRAPTPAETPEPV